MEELDDPFRAPETAGDGYGLVARHRHADGTLQLFYSDGVFGISVFEQRGRLDARRLPAGGRVDEVAGDEAHRYPVPGGEVLVWEGDELVFTCVGDAPIEDLRTFAEDLAREPEPGILTSLARAVLAPFRWG
ncbi:MAG: hypothetical protein M5U14_14335 [Acidimicrobiia bacterium]|nr:hypothetical protein [Acidimicrobiia bacterium]